MHLHWNHHLRLVLLAVGIVAILLSTAWPPVAAQPLTREQDQAQLLLNSRQIELLSGTVAEHQQKITDLQVSLAVVKEVSEQNNKLLWGMLAGILMILVERVAGMFRRNEPTQG